MILSFRIRARSVLGLRPRSVAAPFFPSMLNPICNKENHPGTEHMSVNFDKAASQSNMILRLGIICIQVKDPFHVNHLLIPCSMAFHFDLAHKSRYCGKTDSELKMI
jgi:hypothetical protein